jgi:hypothetical protein
MNGNDEEGLNTLEMIGVITLTAGVVVVIATFAAPKIAAVVGGGALTALGAKLLLAGMAAATGSP